MSKGILVVISGPSGCGKGTICKKIIERNNLWVSVSATTRKPRVGEKDGIDYYFISKENFQNKIKNNEFLEYAFAYGNYYGTLKYDVMKHIENGEDVILEIEMQGALNVKKIYKEAVLIFILPPSYEELKKRIIGRGTETQESLNERFGNARNEIKLVNKYDYAVFNDDVDNAVEKIENIIKSEKYKTSRMIDKIYKIFSIKE